MNDIKFEVPQSDGITVKERIIKFFMKVFDRENAEMLYDAACENGHHGGTEMFDQSIELICKESGLDPNELVAEINKFNNSTNN